MRFTMQLQHLSAAVTSSQRAAQYALKYRDMDEDLHSCILEQLEKVRNSLMQISTSVSSDKSRPTEQHEQQGEHYVFH